MSQKMLSALVMRLMTLMNRFAWIVKRSALSRVGVCSGVHPLTDLVAIVRAAVVVPPAVVW